MLGSGTAGDHLIPWPMTVLKLQRKTRRLFEKRKSKHKQPNDYDSIPDTKRGGM